MNTVLLVAGLVVTVLVLSSRVRAEREEAVRVRAERDAACARAWDEGFLKALACVAGSLPVPARAPEADAPGAPGEDRAPSAGGAR